MGKQTSGLNYIKHLLSILNLVWQTNFLLVLGIFGLTLLYSTFPILIAWTTKLIFDQLAYRTLGKNIDWPSLIWLLIANTSFTIIGKMIVSTNSFLGAELRRKLNIKVQLSIYEKINSFSGISYFEKPALYDTLRLAKEGANFSVSQILQALISSMQGIITLVSFLGSLVIFSPLLVILVVITAFPELYIRFKFGQQRFHLAHTINPDQRQQIFFEYILSTPQPAKELRLFNLGEYFLKKAVDHLQRIQSIDRKQELHELRLGFSFGTLSSIITSVIFILVIIEAISGHLTPGDVILYTSATASVQASLSGLITAISQINECLLRYSHYLDLMTLPQPLLLTSNPCSIDKLHISIEFRGVSFRYSDEHPWILKNVNLFIPAGRCLAIVGINGAGKTTLIKLLTRLYDPTEGQILWDGIDIRRFEPANFRQHIGVIFQDFMRYDLTVQENIGLGDLQNIENIDYIQNAAMKVGLHEKIQLLPQGYQTALSLMFGDESITIDLSGGEWQKIALARMFMRKSELLILDEPTASLDAQSENQVYKKFTELLSNRTGVLISHRFNTLRMAHIIAVLEDGHITECGSHDELMALNGLYAKLYMTQARQFNDRTYT